MPASWPEALPRCFLLGTFSEAMGDGRLRSPTDAGPGKMRRRSSAMARPVSGRMRMTAAQVAILETFVRDDLGGASLPFDFPAPRGEGTWLVRFAEMPSWSRVTVKYMVDISLEALP